MRNASYLVGWRFGKSIIPRVILEVSTIANIVGGEDREAVTGVLTDRRRRRA